MPEMVKYRSELYTEIDQWMTEESTHPQLQEMLVKALSGEHIAILQGNYSVWRTVQKSLCTLPQIHLMQGLIPKGISQIQQVYYTQINSRK